MSRKTKQAMGGFRLRLVFTFYGLYLIILLIALRYHRAVSESTDLFYTMHYTESIHLPEIWFPSIQQFV